jgi:hypothetical protein
MSRTLHRPTVSHSFNKRLEHCDEDPGLARDFCRPAAAFLHPVLPDRTCVMVTNESTARLCGRLIVHPFYWSEVPTNPVGSKHETPVFNHARPPSHKNSRPSFAASVLLQLGSQSRESSGHRLFISVFAVALKVICDDARSNKSWSIVGQEMFQL